MSTIVKMKSRCWIANWVQMAPAALDLKVKERLAARAHLCTFHCTMYNALYTIHCIKHTLYAL